MAGITTIFSRYSVIKQIPIFSQLSWLQLQRIASQSRLVQYKKGETVCKQGDPPDAFYCLVSGRIQAYAVDSDHRRYDVEFIRRGMHFGIVSLLTGQAHSHTYEAINDSLVVRIGKNHFDQILKKIPRLGFEFSQSLSSRLRGKSERPRASPFESRIVSIYSPVKGTGSSTYAVNLALSLQRESQKKVLLVNLVSHSQEPAAAGPDKGAAPQWKKRPIPLKMIIDDDEAIGRYISAGKLGIDLLNVSLDPADTFLVNSISQFVTTLVHDYPYVIVDLPNEMDKVVLKTLTQSDIVQLVTTPEREHLKTTRKVIDQLEEHFKENFDLEKVQVILSGRQSDASLSFEEVNKELDFDVYTKLPHIHENELTGPVLSETMTMTAPRPESEYARAVRMMARKIGGVSVGLVLGGGAALGVAHIGVLRVLERENIPIDVIVGSSMGALIGAFWVTGRDAKGIEELAREFEHKRNMLKLFDPVLPVSGLIAGRFIKIWMSNRGLGQKTFYSTRIPLKVVAYDLARREELVIESGSLVDAVRKSISIPGVMEPVLEKDRIIIDGGVLNPLPTNVLVKLGIKKIIAVNVLQSPEHVTQGYLYEQNRLKQEAMISFRNSPLRFLGTRMSRTMTRAFTPNLSDIIVRSLQASEYLIAEQSAKHADVMIHPDLTGINWFELFKVDELLRRGEEAAIQALPAIQQLMKE